MKIVEVETFVVANPPPRHGGRYFIFVKLTTDNGVSGISDERKNNMSEAHKLRVALAGNARGPKKRFYRAPWGRITEEEWKSGLSAPSSEGGLNCVSIRWQQHLLLI